VYFRRHIAMLGVALALLATPLLALPASADTTADAVIQLTNVQRQNAGLLPLVANASLMQDAQAYAQVMASTNCFGHSCGSTPDFAQRASNAGYTGWTSLAENLAAGQNTPQEVMATWMGSPEHSANILSSQYSEIGVGVAYGGSYGAYWVQVFGARGGQPAIASPITVPSGVIKPASAPSLNAPAGSAAGPAINTPAAPSVSAPGSSNSNVYVTVPNTDWIALLVAERIQAIEARHFRSGHP